MHRHSGSYSEVELKNEDAYKNTMLSSSDEQLSVWHCVGKYFQADELYYPKAIKEEYQSAFFSPHIFVS